MAFNVEPPSTQGAGSSFSVVIDEEDSHNNIETADSTSVITLSLSPTTSTLGGITTVTVTNGVATFTGLTINSTGFFDLIASEGTLTKATSSSIQITPAVGSQLVFSKEPANAVAGTTTSDNINVTSPQIGDVFSIFLNSNPSTKATYTAMSTSVAAVLNGLLTAWNANAGLHNIATPQITGSTLELVFNNISTVTSLGISDSDSSSSKITLTPVPTNSLAPFDVTVEDPFSSIVTSDTSTVTLQIALGPTGALLGATSTATVVNGVATFSSVALSVAGTYVLEATDGTLTTATSTSFVISANVATHYAFTTEPIDQNDGILAPVVVTLYDQYNNVATTSSLPVTMALGSGPTGASLQGTTTVASHNGAATFSSLLLSLPGTYTLELNFLQIFQGGQFVPLVVTSTSFVISAGVATKLAIQDFTKAIDNITVANPQVGDVFSIFLTSNPSANISYTATSTSVSAILNGLLKAWNANANLHGIATPYIDGSTLVLVADSNNTASLKLSLTDSGTLSTFSQAYAPANNSAANPAPTS